MASSSVSSTQKLFKYDVFLSFRGDETRKNFVDHLYRALHDKGIMTYKDDERIRKGEMISDQLLRSIEDSRFHIIIFSKNYASSSWCLEELAKIMECQKKKEEQTAYSIFYDVEPTEVRNRSGYIDRRWEDALDEAAGLARLRLKNNSNGCEINSWDKDKIIQRIVIDISLKLRFINSSIDEKLVGMETRVKNLVSSLEVGSDDDVRIIGIFGIGGGGKTTLARVVFNDISVCFEGKSFVENVREVSNNSSSGLKKLQEQVLKDILNDQTIVINGASNVINMMKKMMASRKVLVVLDDVDDISQLEALAGEPTWFKSGSRIIVTTRDVHVLVAHRVNFIHDVNLLSNEEAICLFSRYAFGRDIPIQRYEELSRKVIHYAAGLPLTIKVLGSHLCGRTKHEWVDAIERLKTIPLKQTLEKLELSYHGLDKYHKEIFLDVACILKGEMEKKAIRALESCGFNGEIGLRFLEQKSLITISHTNSLGMHDHIAEMGRNIVRRSNPTSPYRHSRLWIKEEIEDILVNDLGTKAIRSIKLENANLHPTTIMKGLSKMKNLRFLYVYDECIAMEIDQVDQYLPNTLQSLYWSYYPFGCLSKTFQANNLVNLEMPRSNISQLSEGGERKVLSKLKFLNLIFSKLRSFDLRLTPQLERLDLKECNDFVELYMSCECPMLKYLNLSGSKLRNLKLSGVPCLEELHLEECSEFVDLQMPLDNSKLKYINLSGSKLWNLNLMRAPCLEELHLKDCNDFVHLRMPFECSKLKYLNLSGSKLKHLDLRMVPCLEELHLEKCNNFVQLYMRDECSKLKYLNLSGSKLNNLHLWKVPCLEELHLEECNDFVKLYMPDEYPKLKYLNLSGSKVSNLNLWMVPCLEELHLEECNDFVELYMPDECPKLKYLNLSGSKVSNLNLGPTPLLRSLDLKNCYYLREIKASMGCLKKLVYLNLKKDLFVEKHLESPGFDSLAKLNVNAQSFDIYPLHPNNSLPKFQFECFYDEPLPLSSGNLETLISFGLCTCTNLESFSASICGLQQLGKLTLEGSIPEAPKDLYRLECLEELTLSMKEMKHLPDSICMLNHLKSLELKSCLLLEHLPKDLGTLDCLEKLHLSDCISLRDIPNSICSMKLLKYLHLPYCVQVEKLPEELGSLECLKELNIEGTSITDLPQSIFKLEGLCIIWSRGRLESYGFTSIKKLSKYTASGYIQNKKALTTGASSKG